MIRLVLISCLISMASCQKQDPIFHLQKGLEKFPEYSIILNDMREEGNFIPVYYHQYKVVVRKDNDNNSYEQAVSDWLSVSRSFYQKHTGNLGMTIAAKGGIEEEGNKEKSNTAQPPGYQYVGNPQYGQWVNRGGTSFWEFYGKYALLSSVFGMMNRRVYRDDYDSYRDNYRRGRPYYGKNGEFGSAGTETQKSHRNFYQRRQHKENLRRRAFGDRVKKRATRSYHSGFRRSSFGGFGK